jgi:2-oxo-3-hexenedioate decarboxylase
LAALDPKALAPELIDAYARRRTDVMPPTSRDGAFTLADAYAVEAEWLRLRRASGRTLVGRKVGFANKALWRVLKLDTLVWAHMYDDTVQDAPGNVASLSMARLCAPKIEPEIVFKLKAPLGAIAADPAVALDAVEWLALGFEIIDCVYDGWTFQPPDFVASFGLHAALFVGAPQPVDAAVIPALVDRLPQFKVQLQKNGQIVAEGSGRNSLRSPALCLAELASAIARQPGAEPLAAGELISSGTLTESAPISANEMWTAVLDGLDLPALMLRVEA